MLDVEGSVKHNEECLNLLVDSLGNIERLEMNLRHPLRTSIRINYTVPYIMLCTVSRLRGGTVPSMDGVLKMLGHVELLHIASIINCIPQCYQAPVELRLLLAYECHP